MPVRIVFVRSYFLWDALDAMINFDDLGFLIHGKFYMNAHVVPEPFHIDIPPAFQAFSASSST